LFPGPAMSRLAGACQAAVNSGGHNMANTTAIKNPAVKEGFDAHADRMNGREKWVTQVSCSSSCSSAATTASAAEHFSQEFLSRQCTEIDAMALRAQSELADEVCLQEAVRKAAMDCRFSVTVANPRLPDCPLIAVSDEFEAMTGYRRMEILGTNCRFLNYNCHLEPAQQQAMRTACSTGAPCTVLLQNRKKSGETFLNLLDLRGLTIAQNPNTGQELWVLVGIQADVSGMAEEDVPEDHLAELSQFAAAIRARVTGGITALTVAGALASAEGSARLHVDAWRPLAEPRWRPGEQQAPLAAVEPPAAPAVPEPAAKVSPPAPAPKGQGLPAWRQAGPMLPVFAAAAGAAVAAVAFRRFGRDLSGVLRGGS